MSEWLAIVAEGEEDPKPTGDNHAKPYKTPSEQPQDGFCTLLHGCRLDKSETAQDQGEKTDRRLEDVLDAAVERAAIAEIDGGLNRADAEALAIALHGPAIVETACTQCEPVSLENLTFELIRRLHSRSRSKGTATNE